jgi:hypothetical protein
MIPTPRKAAPLRRAMMAAAEFKSTPHILSSSSGANVQTAASEKQPSAVMLARVLKFMVLPVFEIG